MNKQYTNAYSSILRKYCLNTMAQNHIFKEEFNYGGKM